MRGNDVIFNLPALTLQDGSSKNEMFLTNDSIFEKDNIEIVHLHCENINKLQWYICHR